MELAVGITACLLALGALLLEIRYRHRPGNDLKLTLGDWQHEAREQHRYLLIGKLEFRNHNPYREVMVPEVEAMVKLLSNASLEGITCKTQVIPRHRDEPPRADNYWFAYIVKPGEKTGLEIRIDIRGEDLSQLQTAWLQVHYGTYGPEGQILKVRHIVIPLNFPGTDMPLRWRSTPGADVLPIPTHILTPLDNPVEVVKRYALPHAQPGDVVAISESPLAIMQERWHYHREVKPGWVAKRLCQFFYRTSSLSTACGLQALVDISGSVRVIFALVVGAIAKQLFGIPGVFYQLAGEQARLIDDVTGTLPPYDQFIVLGPDNPQQVVLAIQQQTELAAAIVDANDLKAVKVLAATVNVPIAFLEQALISNPAGNGDEQTPLVLIRPIGSVASPKIAPKEADEAISLNS
ncbi:MAG TPA: F420-0:Gamma-glutamyl ligase [Cyanobacteria bacterium UBA8543]|nr:F420-0:Gamma-glutamyl ligase [Cyanobacteria bacterium UBA8543]